MLRANIDDIIKNSPYSEPVGGFLLGFSSTILGFASLLIVLLILYDYYRFNKTSIASKLYTLIFGENEFVLPLYHKNNIKDNDNVVEATEKPDLTAFIIPAINIDQIGFPLSPQISSSGLKRRTVSTHNFMNSAGAVAPSPTPTRILTPFKHEVPEVKQVV